MFEELEHGNPDDLDQVDLEKSAHDKQAVATVRTEAVSIAKTEFGMELDSDEAQTAIGLFPKVWFGLHQKIIINPFKIGCGFGSKTQRVTNSPA